MGSSSSQHHHHLLSLETFIPLSSIVIVAVAVGFVLPRHQSLGLFLLVWWWVSVCISLSTTIDTVNIDKRNGSFLFQSPQHWSNGDGWGLLLLLMLNVTVLGTLYVWFRHRPKSQGRGLQRFVLDKIPLWGMVALHVYRLDGLSIVMPLSRGAVPTWIGYQMIVLDVCVGAMAVPLALLLHPKFLPNRKRQLLSPRRLKDVLWLWNSMGLYDLYSAYQIFILNWARIGGPLITQPSLSQLGFHPFPLLILFQGPLAVAIHVLFMSHMDDFVEALLLDRLPLHHRGRIRVP